MTNKEKIEKLQGLQVAVWLLAKGLQTENQLNHKEAKAEELKNEILELARGVDTVLGGKNRVEQRVLDGFDKCPINKKKGINQQAKKIYESIDIAIKTLR